MADQIYSLPALLKMLREPCEIEKCGHCHLERQAADEIERLRAIVDRLPTTADGVPIVPGMAIYQIDGSPAIVSGYDWHGDWWEIELEHDRFLPADECYSTREAAEKAMNE